MICFVNDGSTDNTLRVLNLIKQDFPQQIHIVSLLKNSGKAEAVRQNKLLQSKFFASKHRLFRRRLSNYP
jgi:hypothetical protein